MNFLYTLIIYPLYSIIEVAYTLVDKVTNADTPALALEGINDEAENPFTNMKYKLSAEEKKDYTKICKPQAESTRNRENKKYTIPNDVWWTVSDDIYKDENWKQIFPFGK